MAPLPEVIATANVNWSPFLVQTRRDYETLPAKGLAHGVQKEAVQNCWGARVAKMPWACAFRLYPGSVEHPPLITITDSGTCGLTGSATFDASKLGGSEPIPADERLARFEAVFESGGEAAGPGLFGRGKLIFNAASKRKLIWYDSLNGDGTYRFGIREIDGRNYNHYAQILEGDAARAQLVSRSNGRLSPLSEAGTRVTVVDPEEEVVDAMADGLMLAAIEETWWEIIQKYGASITVQVGDAEPIAAVVPSDLGGLPETDSAGWKVRVKENVKVPADGRKYRIKRLHFMLAPEKMQPRTELLGLHVHRKGMVVGKVSLSGVPSEIQDRLVGYALLDTELEDDISEQENTTHYGFSSPNRSPYRNLKQAIQVEFEAFLEKLGYKKDDGSAEDKVRRLAADAQKDLNEILNDLGVPGFGAGGNPAKQLSLTVENLEFPGGSAEFAIGDTIKDFYFSLFNRTRREMDLSWEIATSAADIGVASILIASTPFKLAGKASRDSALQLIDISAPPYANNSKVACTCVVTDSDGKTVARKSFYFYIDAKPDPELEPAALRLIDGVWPRTESLRVDTGESITGLSYELENRTGQLMQARLSVRTLWAAEGNAPLADVFSQDVELGPYQTVTVDAGEVVIDPATYDAVGRGKINLRAHLAALDETPLWPKGYRLAETTLAFYLNMDPAYGFWDETVFHDGGPATPRSEARQLGSRTWRLSINRTHPAFEAVADDDERWRDYLFEEMARQTIFVLLEMGQVEVVSKLAELAADQKLDSLSQADLLKDVAYTVVDRVVAAYYAA